MDLVSIVMPAFNSSATIAFSIESVLAQSYDNFELIIVDDGSSDNTVDIVAEYVSKDRRVCLFHNKNGGSPAKARNCGIGKLSGRFLTFLDADDLYAPNKLEIEVKVFHKLKKIGLVFANAMKFDELGETHALIDDAYRRSLLAAGDHQGDDCVDLGAQFFKYMLLDKVCVNTQTAMIDLKKLDFTPFFNEDVRFAEDVDLWVRLAMITPVVYVDQCISQYRIHNTGVTYGFEGNEKYFLDTLFVYHSLAEKVMPEFSYREKRRMKAKIADLYLSLAYILERKGSHKQAFRYYKASMRNSVNKNNFWGMLKTVGKGDGVAST